MNIEVGQVWIWKDINPFSKVDYIKQRVLIIKDDYVQYKRTRVLKDGTICSSTIESDSIKWFTQNSFLKES